MGLWSFVLPEATTNLISNPSFEIGTTGWTAVGGSIARSSAKQTKGLYSLVVTPTGAGDGVYCALTLEAATEYTFSVDVWGAAGVDYRIYLYDVTAAAILGSAVAFQADGNWRRYVVTATTGANTSIRVYVEVVDASTADFYIDAAQVEAKGYATTYCDGDQDGCSWAAGEHTSTSSRSAQSAFGGRMIDLNSSGYEFEVKASIGVGHAPVEIIDTLPAQGIGGDFQDQVIRPRDFQLVGTIPGTDRADYHTNRLNLVKAFSPHRLATKQPIQLRYSLSQRSIAIDGYYVDGLGKNQQAGPTLEEISLRFRAENPLFRAITGHNNSDRCGGQGALAPSVQTSVANLNYIAWRDLDGKWQDLDQGTNGTVYAIFIASDGSLYAGGSFTQVGSGPTAASKIAKYDFETGTWSALGSGLNGTVYDIAEGPDGKIYVCGNFTTAGGGAANRIAVWDPATTTWSALGSGLNDIGWELVFHSDGNLYVVGAFTTAGGGAVNRVAKWNGSAWSAVGAPTWNSGAAYTLVFGPDGILFVGGSFVDPVGDVDYLGQYNGSSWAVVGGRINNEVRSVAIGPDGSLYITGIFTDAAGVAVNLIARWNGSRWEGLGSGLTGTSGDKLSVSGSGVVFVCGDFSAAGGLTLPDRMAQWLGNNWFPLDIDLPGSVAIETIVYHDGRGLFLGWVSGGTGIAANASEAATNDGTANTYLVLKVTGPGRVYQLLNLSTGEGIYFDLDLLDGETVTLDLRPGKKTFTSTLRGNIIDTILEGSDIEVFHLMPGDNNISLFVDDATAEAFLLWDELHMSIDGVVA